MRVLYLEYGVPWFGGHTGYQLLPTYVERIAGYQVEITRTSRALWQRGMGKFADRVLHFNRSSVMAAAELRFHLKLAMHRNTVGHVLWLEDHLGLWASGLPPRSRRVATIHLPPSQWTEPMRRTLARVEHAMVLYERDLEWFSRIMGPDRVHFVGYGVDTEFFRPAENTHDNGEEKRILFAGHWLRNTQMLARVIAKVVACQLPVSFDLLVPVQWRNVPGLTELAHSPHVRWHANLNDVELRNLYQRSYLLLLPLNDGGANTALVEGLACGLPVVTTDRGGTRSYGAGSLYPVVANDDDDAMLELIAAYVRDPNWRQEVSARCRRFAEEKLAWEFAAMRHVELYQRLFS